MNRPHDFGGAAPAPPIDFDRYLLDDPTGGRFTVSRDIFRDPWLYELEMKYIFEANWVFLCHQSQIPNPGDYYTTHIGRQPVVVIRDAAGVLNAFINSCPHKGSKLFLYQRGNGKFQMCPYHGWTFDNHGQCVSIKDHAAAAYTDSFERIDHNLTAIARIGEYRGWIFGSLGDEVPSLDEHLGDTRLFIDLLVDQSPRGMELVPGNSSYTFPGNWKLQIENCLDGYHLNVAHLGFLEITKKRIERLGDAYTGPDIKAMFNTDLMTGSFGLKRGHAMFFSQNPAPQFRPLWPEREALKARYGAAKAEWMIAYGRNMTIFPNLQCTDNAVIGQFRTLRPLAYNRTEMQIYCWVPVGESAQARAKRLRGYEDFFDIAATGTPDDFAAYKYCQQGYEGRKVKWQQGYERGMGNRVEGADEYAKALGIEPVTSCHGPLTMSDETLFQTSYREWLRLMKAGQARELAATGEDRP